MKHVVFVVKGLGEYAQAYSIAHLLKLIGYRVRFVAEADHLCSIIREDSFSLSQVTESSIQRTLNHLKCDILFLCNSHTVASYNLSRPPQVHKVFSLDSNWLFHNQKYDELQLNKFHTVDWIDTIIVVFPEHFFKRNLSQNGGFYHISSELKRKVITPGFVPTIRTRSPVEIINTRRSLGIPVTAQMVVSYFSRVENHATTPYGKLILKLDDTVYDRVKAMSRLHETPIHYVSLTRKTINGIPFGKNEHLSSKMFEDILAAADLIVMHFGYGTLTKVFSLVKPVISFMPEPDNPVHCHYFELKPAIDLQMIDPLFYDSFSTAQLDVLLTKNLFNENYRRERIRNQVSNIISGEIPILRLLES